MKPWYASKTIWLSLAVVALGLVEYLTGALGSVLTERAAGIAAVVLGALGVVLRAVTSGSITVTRGRGGGAAVLALGLLLGLGGCGTLSAEERAWLQLGIQVGTQIGQEGGKYACARLEDPDAQALCLRGVSVGTAAASAAGAIVGQSCPVPGAGASDTAGRGVAQ